MLRKLILGFALTCSFAQAASPGFKSIGVAELVEWMKSSSTPVYIYDANGDSTRKGVGIIPGAQLLSSYSGYDVKKELPADHKARLVFYCANTRCTASHDAAKRALDAGFKNVSVMVDGIHGWKKANEPVETLSKKAESVEPKVALKLLDTRTAVLYDLREDEERQEVIPRAQFMPTSHLDTADDWKAFVAKLPARKTVLLHCASGRRSKKIAEKLSQEGIKALYFEGPDQWAKAGLPLEKGH